MIPDSISRLLILLGAGVWLGAFIMLGYGVAPVNFGVTEAWELEGTNPRMSEQPIHHRTIGGELTGNSIMRMNQIESLCLLLMVVGLATAWSVKTGSRKNRIIRTLILTVVAGLFYYYAVSVGGRLIEIRNTIPIDFSITTDAMKQAVHLEFDRLHTTYTRGASVTMLLIGVLFGLTVFDGKKEK